MSRVLTRLIVTLAAVAAVPAASQSYAYRLQVTPQQGHVDPSIQQRYTRQFEGCQKRAVTTRDNEQCFVAEFTRQDDALNRAWRSTYGRTAPSRKPALLAAQRRWLGDRDLFCRGKANGFAGGTIMPVVYVGCRVEVTIRRTMWLEKLRA